MWFLSKYTKKKRQEKGGTKFLRKGLSMRRENRTIAVPNQASRVPAGVLLLWLMFFGTIFYIALFSVFFIIGVPQITGMTQVSEETLRGSVEMEISGKYLGIFPRRDFFLIRTERLEGRLLQEYPLLASVNVTRVFPDGLRVEVIERKKIILWCSGEPTGDAMPSGGRCSLIDEEGKARESDRALLPENIPYVLFVTDTSGKPVAVGEKIFDPSYGAFIVRMNELFPEQIGLSLMPEFSTVSRFANEVRAKTGEGWEVYVSSDVPIESSLNALKLLFEKELPQERRMNLAYIDLRTENRVYYAFRDGENTENPSDIESPVPTEEKKTETESKKKKK